MKILVVNDDGYNSEGIAILAAAFEKYGEVYVVAPHYGQSGASSSITVTDGLAVHDHGNRRYSVEGTPADCVKYAFFGLNMNPDLVVSGINNGYNIGVDTIYSGTIGAAMEALIYQKNTIAFSTEFNAFDVARREISGVIEFIFHHRLLSEKYLLNVNFVHPSYEQSKGIVITDLGFHLFDLRFEVKDGKYYSHRVFRPYNLPDYTDIWAFKNGYTSITPLKLGNSDTEAIEILRNQVKNKGCI